MAQVFKVKFKSLFKISAASMSVVSVLVMAKLNRTKAKAAVKYAASRSMQALQRDTISVQKTGAVPVLDASLKFSKFTEMSGVVQLRATTDKAVQLLTLIGLQLRTL